MGQKTKTLAIFAAGLVSAVVPMWAHHSMDAMYDDKKSISVKGPVSAYEWQNPHVMIYVESNSASWQVELPSRLELRRVGWTRDSVKIGDIISVDANPARDGSKKVAAKSV